MRKSKAKNIFLAFVFFITKVIFFKYIGNICKKLLKNYSEITWFIKKSDGDNGSTPFLFIFFYLAKNFHCIPK